MGDTVPQLRLPCYQFLHASARHPFGPLLTELLTGT